MAAVVGHPVPAGTLSINHLKPTKADDEVSAVVTTCIYGSVTSLKALSKVVVVGFEVTSKALTGTELMRSLKQAQALKFVFAPYAGLGMKAFYHSFTDGSIPIQGIVAIDGTTIYSSGAVHKDPGGVPTCRAGEAVREALTRRWIRLEQPIVYSGSLPPWS